MNQRSLASLVLALVPVASGAASPANPASLLPAPQAAEDARPSMESIVRRYETDLEAIERFYSLSYSETRLRRLEEAVIQWMDDEGVWITEHYEELDRQERVDWHLLLNHVSRGDHERRAQRLRIAEMRPLLPFLEELPALEEERWTLAPVEPREVAGRFAVLAAEINELTERVTRRRDDQAEDDEGDRDELPTTPVIANRAARTLGMLRNALGSWFRHYDGYDPEFAWWVREPFGALDAALGGYREHLRREVAGLRGEDDDPLIGDPIGRAALEQAIRDEFLAQSPEDLIAIGERELAWCEAEMAKAAAELGFDDARAALEHVKGLHAAPGRQDELVLEQALHAIDYVSDLVTIPELCAETWRLDMMSPEQQRTLPYAYYGGQKMVVAYPTEDMDHERKVMSQRGNNEHFSRIVTPHELIPGHHLQGFMAQRYASHRGLFRTPFFVEGWCLHWEMLLWDLGYARGSEDRMGMLFWRAHRCARILVSLKFHLGEMTPDEMIDLLVERVGHERDGATAEVRRYVGEAYGPLYQAGYMIGGLQIRALYRELVIEGTMTPKEFHDAALRVGSIPVALVRASLIDEPLERDWRPTWEFAPR